LPRQNGQVDIANVISTQLSALGISNRITWNQQQRKCCILKLKFRGMEEYVQITPYQKGKELFLSWAVNQREAADLSKHYKYLEFDIPDIIRKASAEFVRSDKPDVDHYAVSRAALGKSKTMRDRIRKGAWWHVVLVKFRIIDAKIVRDSINKFHHLRLSITHYPDEGFREASYEGGSRRIIINKYERNPQARAECISHYGYECAVCGLTLSDIYGQAGEGYIHIHHLQPVSNQKRVHRINPITDLRPVCPNCHAMIHQSEPPFSILALRRVMSTHTLR
jgi:hypothetical protein